MDVSKLKFDDESMRLIVLSLAREVHHFALSRGIASHSVEHQLPLVFSILDSKASYLIDTSDVVTGEASCIAAVRIAFSDKGYRLLACAAKDRVANIVD